MSKHIICPVCKKDDTIELFKKGDAVFVQCKNDKLVYVNPQPDSEILREHYDMFGRNRIASHKGTLESPTLADFRNRFLRFRETGRLLEIGASDGQFLLNCQKDGWQCYGVEISLSLAEFVRNTYGFTMTAGPVHDAHYPENYFDVVAAWQTIEHVPDPREVFQEVFRILRPGGLFAFSVPCWKSLSIRLLGKRYRYIGRDHLFYFNCRNAEMLLSDTGFSKIRCRSRGLDPFILIKDMFKIPDRVPRQKAGNNNDIKNAYSPGLKFISLKFLRPLYNMLSGTLGVFNMGECVFGEAIK